MPRAYFDRVHVTCKAETSADSAMKRFFCTSSTTGLRGCVGRRAQRQPSSVSARRRWEEGTAASLSNPRTAPVPMEERLSLLSTTERAAESSDRNPESSASRAASCSNSCAFCALSEAHGSGARLPAAIARWSKSIESAPSSGELPFTCINSPTSLILWSNLAASCDSRAHWC